MKATHRNYLHPRHLRVEDAGEVFCMAPSCSQYPALNKPGLPDFAALTPDERRALPRHSSSWSIGSAT